MKNEMMMKGIKIFIIIMSFFIAFFILLFLGAGWYFSDILYDKAFNPVRPPREKDTKVLQVDERRIILERTTPFDVDYRNKGVFGIEWDGGFGHITDIISSDEKQAARAFSLISGTLPQAGTEALVDGYIYIQGKPFLLEPFLTNRCSIHPNSASF
jgi:hypothetical protein